MKDLIERQAAIDIVFSACKDVAATECAVRELEELPQEGPRWIPCSERPAEASCLACDKFGQMFIPTSIVVINDKCFDGTDFDFAKPDEFLKGTNIGHGVRILPREITAWMPLPEPWEGENNDRA